jgi:ribosome biogenesis GTPase
MDRTSTMFPESIDGNPLTRIGFNARVAREWASLHAGEALCMRIIEAHRAQYHVHTGSEVHVARAIPEVARACELVVGDWVAVTPDRHDQLWIAARLPAYSSLSRVEPSGAHQALVTNVDCAFLLMGLTDDFSPRRLERYLVLVRSAGVQPVVVLTKADLCSDVDARLTELRDRLPSSVICHAVNATDAGPSTECLVAFLGAGRTGVLLGSSGAGKSTLANSLVGSPVQATGGTRESDGRGRHTTTTRQLLLLPQGGCLIDTPGLRGLRLSVDESALDSAFEDISDLAKTCRFRDCTHDREPGCAVRAALSADRLANYQKLRREIAHEHADARERHAKKAQSKVRSRAYRALQKLRREDS